MKRDLPSRSCGDGRWMMYGTDILAYLWREYQLGALALLSDKSNPFRKNVLRRVRPLQAHDYGSSLLAVYPCRVSLISYDIASY